MTTRTQLISVCLIAAALGACDQLGIETPDKVAARVEADGKAIGGACRHAGRALEDCYEMNRRASKAAVYAGWRDMDAYMRENNIAVVKPTQAEEEPAAKVESGTKGEAKTESTAKPAEAGASKAEEGKTGSAHNEKAAKAAANKTS